MDVHLLAVGQHQDGYDNAFEAAMAKVPYDQSLSPVPQELRLVRGSVYGLASSLGTNRINLKRHYGAIDELGNPVYSREFWQNATEAANTTPADPSRPVIAVAVGSTVGQRALVSVNLTVTYHVQFFELEYNRIPTEQVEAPKDNSVLDIGEQTSKSRIGVKVPKPEIPQARLLHRK